MLSAAAHNLAYPLPMSRACLAWFAFLSLFGCGLGPDDLPANESDNTECGNATDSSSDEGDSAELGGAEGDLEEETSEPMPHDDPHGMTWVVHEINPELGVVLVGSDALTDPYYGDTPCTEARPILCLDTSESPANPCLDTNFYYGWAAGRVAVTSPIVGAELTSLDAADSTCADQLGPNYRMAEFHHGQGGWNWWAYADVEALTPDTGRFWVHINDQPANCWDSP